MQGVPRLDELIAEYHSHQALLDRFGVYFLRDITDVDAERFAKSMLVMATGLKGFPGRRITVYINSGGGSVGAGFAMMESMYKVKRDFGIPVDTVILGYAYSMGAIIAQAGDKRSMGFFSTMMLHGGTWAIVGEDQKIFTDYQKLANLYQSKIGELFSRRTGLHTPRWWTRFIYSGRDRFLSPTECLKLRLVDEICDFESCYLLSRGEPIALPGALAVR
jgi:ATP-dependent protease ClpP protease subunit